MFLTATNRKVYVWQMEHLESLAQQQQHQQQQNLQQLLRYRSSSAVSLASSSDLGSEQQQHYTPPISPSRTPLGPTPSPSLASLTSQPDTPAPSSTLKLVTSISTTESTYEGFGASVETRVKPCLTAVLTVSNDMWCGNVTHHDPPLLLIGSRSSPVKLSTIALTRDIIDPNKVYNNDYTPLQTAPKSWPFQGAPTGHGLGVMCIDSSSGRLAVGCTAGSIHVLNMDPAKRSLASLRSNTAASVVTLPHLTRTQIDSIRSISPVNPPLPQAPVPIKSAATTTTVITTTYGGGYLRRPSSTVFKSSTNTNIVTSGRPGVLMLPSPNQSPTTTVASSMFVSPTTHMPRNSPPRGGIISSSSYNHKSAKNPISPQSEYEEQEVLVDSYEVDISRVFGDSDMSIISSLDFSFKASTPSSSTSSLTSSAPLTSSTPSKEVQRRSRDFLKPLSIGGKAGRFVKSLPTSPTSRATTSAGGPKSASSRSPSNSNTTSTPTPTSSSSYTSPTLSSLSKFIPSSPSKMMMRRRANSAAWTQQVTSTATTTVTRASSPSDGTGTATVGTLTGSSSSTSRPINIPSPVSALTMKGRNRSDPNLLAVHAVSESPGSTSRSLAKSWSLPSPWNSAARNGSRK